MKNSMFPKLSVGSLMDGGHVGLYQAPLETKFPAHRVFLIKVATSH